MENQKKVWTFHEVHGTEVPVRDKRNEASPAETIASPASPEMEHKDGNESTEVQTKSYIQNGTDNFGSKNKSELRKPLDLKQNGRDKNSKKYFRATLTEKLDSLTQLELLEGYKQAERVEQEILAKRDLTRTVVHIAIESLMAAIEVRDDPTLNDVPMAVCSKTMVQSVNNLGAAYGVKVKMPINVAEKRCSKLKIVPCNYSKYADFMNELENILSCYKAKLTFHLEYVEMDFTAFLQTINENGNKENFKLVKLIDKIVERIYKKTRIRAAAGIAPTSLLAKLASMVKQPYGTHHIPPVEAVVKGFLRGLPISQYCGICSRTEFILNALELYTTDEVWDKRSVLYSLVSLRTFKRLMGVCLGVSVNTVYDDVETLDGIPRTIIKGQFFYGTFDRDPSMRICAKLCVQVSDLLKSMELGGKVVVVGISTVEFETKKKAYSMKEPTNDSTALLKITTKLLNCFYAEEPNMVLNFIRISISELKEMPSGAFPIQLELPSEAVKTTQEQLASTTSNNPNRAVASSQLFSRLKAPGKSSVPTNDQVTSGESRHAWSTQEKRGGIILPFRTRRNAPFFQRRFLPYIRNPRRSHVFVCPNPNCKTQFQTDFAETGEKLMAKHVDVCLIKKFPQLID